MKNILFVCVGNSCRSPIAAWLTKKYYGDSFGVSSGGTAPGTLGPSEKSIRLMRELYGLDISGHKPKNFREYDLKSFDYIIALSEDVETTILWANPPHPDKVLNWDISDPLGKEYADYVNCAKEIEKKVVNQLKYLTDKPV